MRIQERLHRVPVERQEVGVASQETAQVNGGDARVPIFLDGLQNTVRTAQALRGVTQRQAPRPPQQPQVLARDHGQ